MYPSKFQPLHVCLLGLDSAGKTTALYRMKFDQYINTGKKILVQFLFCKPFSYFFLSIYKYFHFSYLFLLFFPVPTIGFNCEKIKLISKGISFLIWGMLKQSNLIKTICSNRIHLIYSQHHVHHLRCWRSRKD